MATRFSKPSRFCASPGVIGVLAGGGGDGGRWAHEALGLEGPPFHYTFEQSVDIVMAVWQGAPAAATIADIECYLSTHKETH